MSDPFEMVLRMLGPKMCPYCGEPYVGIILLDPFPCGREECREAAVAEILEEFGR